MSRTGPFGLMFMAALFGLLSASLVSIGLVKAAHNFPHRVAVTSPHVADRFPTVRSDHLALLIANSNYPDADAAMTEMTAAADTLANVLRDHGFLLIPSSCAASVASPPPMRPQNHDWRFDGI
jgi:hypothetical protein